MADLAQPYSGNYYTTLDFAKVTPYLCQILFFLNTLLPLQGAPAALLARLGTRNTQSLFKQLSLRLSICHSNNLVCFPRPSTISSLVVTPYPSKHLEQEQLSMRIGRNRHWNANRQSGYRRWMRETRHLRYCPEAT